MGIERSTSLGNINISEEAIATLAGGVVSECYGVVGMASQKVLKDGLAELLKKENYSRGVVVRKTETSYELDLYIVISFGVKITEVVAEV
ncbi:MAG: Asp23/Gls24 family envelope stress response protein, partial [Erysipelotrichaceae bacterium]|nr:Asp23/Gls24 family envelope stress response protein [Erysipelotrichaceae bacterium]